MSIGSKSRPTLVLLLPAGLLGYWGATAQSSYAAAGPRVPWTLGGRDSRGRRVKVYLVLSVIASRGKTRWRAGTATKPLPAVATGGESFPRTKVFDFDSVAIGRWIGA